MLSTFKYAKPLGELVHLSCATTATIEPLKFALGSLVEGRGQIKDAIIERTTNPPIKYRLAPRKAFPSNTPNGEKEPVQEAPRFDDLYYKPEDKLNRDYQKTWVEYPPRIVKRKELCIPNN